VLGRAVPERFAVAFSYASEDRQLVLPVAQKVKSHLESSPVFLDHWYEHLIPGQDADLLLQKIYKEQAELVVVCLSGAYMEKVWPKTEYRAVRERLMRAVTDEERHGVFPVLVGEGAIDGVPFNDAPLDIRHRKPAEVAGLIIARLDFARGCAPRAKPAAARWPVDPPELPWLMAGHGEVRAAFARLLCEVSPQRALLVQGGTETGKSHMAEQMLRSAPDLPGVAFGRFDFKGTASLEVETEAFAGPLGIKPPTGQTLNERFMKILAELQERAQPTVLIFDTYEAAGESKGWIERVLLPRLVSVRWLRVVITGQSVPARVSSAWEGVAASTLILCPPSVKEWHAYGQENRDDNPSLALVKKLHKLSGGKPGLLASLLGPVS
jgi:TIR domain